MFLKNHQPLKKSIACLAWTFLFCAAAYGQQESRHGAAPAPARETAARVPGNPPNIVSDNLDRVAASAEQILEVVNREAGLMVEFKRLLAQDAGTSGQILEESDLTDVAVAERLRSELRARVLATHLLQRYGYLVPRVNPDSDLAAEQRLVRQDRAQMMARAAERRDGLVENSGAGRNAACDAQSAEDCGLSPALPEDRESLPSNPGRQLEAPRSSAPLQRTEDSSPRPMTSPDDSGPSPDQHPGNPVTAGAPETMLTAARLDVNPAPSWSPRMTGNGSGENPALPSASEADLQSRSGTQRDQSSSGAETPRAGRRSEPQSLLLDLKILALTLWRVLKAEGVQH
jgi:hypothetical protein